MATKDITSGTTFLDGDTAPTVRTKLNDNLTWAEGQMQGIEDRLEGSLDSYPGNGVLSGCVVSAGTGLSVNVTSGQAIIGYVVDVATHTNDGGTGITDNATNYCWLRQDDTLEFNTDGSPPAGQAAILLATLVASGGNVTSVNNRPVGRTELLPKCNSFTCTASEAVGDAVYVKADGTVGKAKADSASTMPAVGVIIAKPTSTSCQVARPGQVSDVHSALSAGSRYFVSAATAGAITATKPTAPNIAQILGVAISATQLLLLTDATDDNASGGGGSGAPTDASYVTIAAESGLSNESILGTAVIMRGTHAARPASAANGAIYYETDTHIAYRFDGGALQWEQIAAVDHADLAGVLPDDHHARLHALSGISDHSGTLGVGQHGTLADGDHSARISGSARIRILTDDVAQGTREGMNLIAGPGIILTPSDDPGTGQGDEKVDIEIEATGGGGGEPHNVLSGTHLDAEPAAAVRGDLIAADATPEWTRLPVGADGEFLRSDGSDPSWQPITEGDLPDVFVKTSGDQEINGVKTFGSIPVLPASDPTTDDQAARKAYVDAVAIGLEVRASCRAATTANITLSGEQTIDGVAVVADDRVLAKNQTAGTENGIYVCAAGAWSRATDYDASAEVQEGTFTSVLEGTANANTQWVQTTKDPVLDTDPLVFSKLSAQQVYTASLGVEKVGLDFRADLKAGGGLSLDGQEIKLDTVVEGKGGTGETAYAKGDLLYAQAVNDLTKLAIGATGQVLKASATGVPEWADIVEATGDLNNVYANEATDRNVSTVQPNWTEVLSATITPQSVSSKILIFARTDFNKDNNATVRIGYMRLRRGADFWFGQVSACRSAGNASSNFGPCVLMAVNAPGSTDPQTYSMQCATSGGTIQANRKELVLVELLAPVTGEEYTAGDGLDLAANEFSLDLKANDGLAIKATELGVDYDDATVGIVSNKLAVKSGGIGADQLAAVLDLGGKTSLEIPNAAAPTVDAEGEIAWDTDDDKLLMHDGAAAVIIAAKTKSRSFVIATPAATDDFVFWQTPRAITITKVSAICLGGTNVIGCLDEWNGAASAIDAAVDSDWTITTSEYVDTSFTNAGIDAGDWIGWHTTSVSGTVNFLCLTFEYYES